MHLKRSSDPFVKRLRTRAISSAMEKESVPQDNSPTYPLRKTSVTPRRAGKYTHGFPSPGWDVESFATQTAGSLIDRLRVATLATCARGSRTLCSGISFSHVSHTNRMELRTFSPPRAVALAFSPPFSDDKNWPSLSERILTLYRRRDGHHLRGLAIVPAPSRLILHASGLHFSKGSGACESGVFVRWSSH